MPNFGAGVLVPVGPGVPPSTIPAALPASCISLARYAQIVSVHECSFWGVYEDDTPDYQCHAYWTERERWSVARYLQEAQDEIEAEVSFPLCRRWITGERTEYKIPLATRWGYVAAGGVQATEDIELASAVSYATEPATIGPIATTLTDTTEIRVFYPGSDRQIDIENISISGGFLTIWIPRCRLVSPDSFNTKRDEPLYYNAVANFTATVDVKRIYNDPSTNAELIWPHDCSTTAACGEYTQDACIYVKDGKLGIVDVLPAEYASGWTRKRLCRSIYPTHVELNYLAGMYPITPQAEDTIIRLAHSKMPEEPCGCDTTQRMWARDRHIPEVLTRERLNCPFGLSDGAWTAWRFTQSFKTYRIGVSL